MSDDVLKSQTHLRGNRDTSDHRAVFNVEPTTLVVTLDDTLGDCRNRTAVGGLGSGMCGRRGLNA
jgi:hypothetical protein